MFRFSILLLCLFLSVSSFSQEKVVHLKYENGNPHVVYYYEMIFLKRTIVKKEVYYENGNLEYSGELRNNQEHGSWKYYHSNGRLKAEETWRFGKEIGEWKEYDEKGKLLKKMNYQSGKLIKTITY